MYMMFLLILSLVSLGTSDVTTLKAVLDCMNVKYSSTSDPVYDSAIRAMSISNFKHSSDRVCPCVASSIQNLQDCGRLQDDFALYCDIVETN
jgi:hypothetical protein